MSRTCMTLVFFSSLVRVHFRCCLKNIIFMYVLTALILSFIDIFLRTCMTMVFFSPLVRVHFRCCLKNIIFMYVLTALILSFIDIFLASRIYFNLLYAARTFFFWSTSHGFSMDVFWVTVLDVLKMCRSWGRFRYRCVPTGLLRRALRIFWPDKIANKEWYHDDFIKWKHFSRYCPFLKGIHRSPVDSPTNGWANTRDTGDMRRHRAHYDVAVIRKRISSPWSKEVKHQRLKWLGHLLTVMTTRRNSCKRGFKRNIETN